MSGVKGINAGRANWRYKHGETKTRLFKIWGGMRERCQRAKHPHFKDYGGRGITVCDEWRDYVAFATWARNNGYSDDLTIDRIDVNGNYEPNNCRWIPMSEQHRNTRVNRVVEYKGKQYILAELAEFAGIGKTTLKERLNAGWSVEDAVNRPVRCRTRGSRPSKGYERGEKR